MSECEVSLAEMREAVEWAEKVARGMARHPESLAVIYAANLRATRRLLDSLEDDGK